MPQLNRRRFRAITCCAVAGASLLITGCAPVLIGAGAATGVAVSQERGLKAAATDTAISTEIHHLWFQESDIIFTRVQIQVQEGRVLLSGVVPDPESRVDAVRLAWQANGVREVINEIEVADDTTLTDKARDTWIAAKLKGRLLLDKNVSSINYSVEVVNQSIFLIGIAQDQTELDRVIAHTKDVSYVRRVVSYVRVKEEAAQGS